METENNKSIPNQDNNNEIDICEEIKKSIEAIILYRSLYILKKKIDLKKAKLRTLYNSFNLDKNSNVAQYNSYQVNIENFVIISETIFKECKILITTLSNPKDIFLSNIFLNMNQKMNEMNAILNEIKNHITEENTSLVKKYNNLFYEKKLKPNLIKNILENKQNKNKIIKEDINIEKIETKKEEQDTEIINIKYEKEEKGEIKIDEEEEEIQRPIVEYNRKGKVIKSFCRMANDNLTLSAKKENEQINKRKVNRIKNAKYFQLSDSKDDFIGNHMQNIIEKSNNFNSINELEEYNIENDKKNKTVSIYDNLIDIENGKNFNNILYIETLPLIIADYMQQFPFYCIIETENDLAGELNLLFDKELIEKMSSYEEALKLKNQNSINNELIKNEKIKAKIENNIKIYENLINQKKEKGESVIFLEKMLERLLAKNIVIEERISQLKNENNTNISKYELNTKNELNATNNNETNDLSKYSNLGIKITEQNTNKSALNNEYNNSKMKITESGREKLATSQLSSKLKFGKIPTFSKTIRTNKLDPNTKIMNSIKEIFNFYSSQHNLVGAKGLFEDIKKNKELLSSSEFYKFTVEYNIPITRQKSLEIYKKTLSLSPNAYTQSQLMDLNEFISSLKIIANYINQSKLDLLQKNILQEKEKLKVLEEKQLKYKEAEKFNLFNNLNNNNNANINNKYTIDKGQFYYECEKKKIMNSIFNLDYKYNNEKSKTENEIMNNFYAYIGINSNNDYKKKFKGFLLPFKTHGKKKSLTKVKYGIGSHLESEIKEVNKIYMMQKNEQKKLILSKEVLEKQMTFKKKKELFKLKNEKLCINLDKKQNMKYSDKLIDFKNELKRRKEEMLEKLRREEYERKNIISWHKLEDYDINNLDIDENDKKIFIDSDDSDKEIINKIPSEKVNEKIKKKIKKKRLNKNNSAVELLPKKKILLPPISQKPNEENVNNNEKEDDFNLNNINQNEFKENKNNDNSFKNQDSNLFGNLSAIADNNQNIMNNFE